MCCCHAYCSCMLYVSKWLLCEYQISSCSSIAGLVHVSALRPSSPSRNCSGQFGSLFHLLSVLSLKSNEEVSVVFMTNGEAVTFKVSQPSMKASMATNECSTKSASFYRLYRA
ncbi:hypothetical protein VPH35_125024 [Triticum aestivum]